MTAEPTHVVVPVEAMETLMDGPREPGCLGCRHPGVRAVLDQAEPVRLIPAGHVRRWMSVDENGVGVPR